MTEARSELSEVEQLKERSRGLRGTLAAELGEGGSHFSEEARQLLKFHGSYEQEDRDQRRERKKAGLEPAYQFLTRSRIPGGVLTAAQYLAHDDLAARYGNGTLRVTTRQTIQLHGIVKGELRATIRALNDALVSTLATCGDIGRNVVCCPAPLGGARDEALELARRLSDGLLPRTRAYHEVWLDGERVAGGEESEEEPLYGTRFLPRKFKVGIAFPDDNCTDVYSDDLGLLAIVEDGRIAGYNVLVGGGLGQTHGKEETYPRLASPLGFVRPEEVLETAEAVVAVQRDHGNRSNRRRARLKYLIDERGLDWFRAEVEARLGRPLPAPRPVTAHEVHDHLGWHPQGDGRWFYGMHVESGRIRDTDEARVRSALRTLLERFGFAVHLTPQQNVLLVGIEAEQRAEVERMLREHGVRATIALPVVRRWAMACPALPTCGLAVAESERVLPGVLAELEHELERLGLEELAPTVRMTGCPNGCARPYTAELAFVGRSLGKYVVYVGGNREGTRLAARWRDLVPLERLAAAVVPLLERYREERLPAERFGDFWHRVGLDAAEPVEARV